MTGIRQRLNTMIVRVLTSLVVLLHMSAQDSPDDLRPIYTYFPSILVCDEALKGDGPSIGMVTIGETTLQEVEEIYADYFDVDIEYFEESGETLIYLRHLDGTIYQRVDVCVVDGVIVASNKAFPSVADLENLDNQSDEVQVPVSFQLVGIRQFTARYGIPDVVTYSPEPTHRVAFWFEQGVAAEFYVRYDDPESEYPPAFGALSRVIYFPFQDVVGYEDRWPFNQTYPEERYIIRTAPYVATDVPTERNPFDFDAMIATITAESSRTPTPTKSSRRT